MKNCIVVILLCLSVSCASKHAELSEAADIDAAPATAELKTVNMTPPAENTKFSASLVPASAKLIKTADYRFKVADVKKTSEYIQNGLARYQAFISSSNMSTLSYEMENKMTIRVQNERFDDLLKYIDAQALVVTHRNVSTVDVAKQFVDLESRLRTKREVEARYMQILRNKAGTVEEVLDAERQIGELHEEIEATISRINFLKDEVAYSTINLEFFQTVEVQVARDDNTFLDDVRTAFLTSFDGLTLFVVGLIYIWPILLIAGSIVLYLKLRRRKVISL